MNHARRNAARLLFTVLAAGLPALVVVALACGPSAPAGQDDGDATPEATATPTATATATATPTTAPTATPQANTDDLSPEVNAVLALYATEQSAVSGASGSSPAGPPLPEKITLYISTKRNFNQPVQTFLTGNGATVLSSRETAGGLHYHSGVKAEVPVSLIPALSKQPGVSYIVTEYERYEKLGWELSNLVMLYEAGDITAEEAAARTGAQWFKELVDIEIYYDSCESLPGIVRFIETEMGRPPWWYDPDANCYGSHYPFVSDAVPFLSLVRLSQQPGVLRIGPILRDPL